MSPAELVQQLAFDFLLSACRERTSTTIPFVLFYCGREKPKGCEQHNTTPNAKRAPTLLQSPCSFEDSSISTSKPGKNQQQKSRREGKNGGRKMCSVVSSFLRPCPLSPYGVLAEALSLAEPDMQVGQLASERTGL